MLWISGFFGAGAFIHAVRALLRYPVTVNEMNVPMGLSLALFAVFFVLSAVTGYYGSGKQCREK